MHEVHPSTVAHAAGEVTSEPIAIHQFEKALYQIPAAYEGTGSDLVFVGCTSPTGTFVTVTDSTGTEITATPSHAKWQPFSSELFGLSFVKIVTNTAQATARTIAISGSSPRG